MPRKASFDVDSFETQIIETILHSPVAMSRREIFDRCGFDNENKARLSAFDRLMRRADTKALVESRGDKKNRVYIAKYLNQPASQPESPAPRPEPQHRDRPPTPTFEVKMIDHAQGVLPALGHLSEVSGIEKLVALGVDKRPTERDIAFRMRSNGYDHPIPVREIILSAGSVVYYFEIPKIMSSLVGTNDDDGVRGFAPFRAFFADHTVVCYNAILAFEPLVASDLLPLRLLETRLAVRMLHYARGVVGDDSLKASVIQYLQHIPYNARAGIVATLIPLLHVLRERLGTESDRFDAYCSMLPILTHLQVQGLPFQEVTPAYEVRGDGSVCMNPDLSLLTDDQKASCSNGSTLITVRFSSKPKMYQLLPALRAADQSPVALLDDELVFNADETMPERTAIVLMPIIFGVTDSLESIRLTRGYGWGTNNWKYRSPQYRAVPEGWCDNWWDSWITPADVQSVLKS